MFMDKENVWIGVDIEEIDRFRKFDYDYNDSFLNRLFTKQELEYCFSKADPAPHLAVRYAAKEAVVKALNEITDEVIDYKTIEIRHTEKGTPIVGVEGLEKLNIKLSLAHEKDKALAFVLIMK